MDIVELIKDDHKTVDGLFQEINSLVDNREPIPDELLITLITELSSHLEAEEKVLYARLKEEKGFTELMEEGVEEHSEISQLIDEIQNHRDSLEAVADKLNDLQDQVEHHVEVEESETLPKVKSLWAAEFLEQLAEEMKDAKRDIQSGAPSPSHQERDIHY